MSGVPGEVPCHVPHTWAVVPVELICLYLNSFLSFATRCFISMKVHSSAISIQFLTFLKIFYAVSLIHGILLYSGFGKQ